MANAASPRNFIFDDDTESSAMSSVLSSVLSSPVASPAASPVASPINTPMSAASRRSSVRSTPRGIHEEAALSPKSGTNNAKQHQQQQQQQRAKPSPRHGALTPSSRDTPRRAKEHRDEVETPSSRASGRRYSPRKKSVLHLSQASPSASTPSNHPSPDVSPSADPDNHDNDRIAVDTGTPKEATAVHSPTGTTDDDLSSEEDTVTVAIEDIEEDDDEPSPRSKAQKRLFNTLREPDRSLKDLLTVLTDQNTSQLRRVNACGAIKTLTLNKNNQVLLARTRGVVSTITSVLCRVDASEEERTRCINALMHLSVPEKNWHAVYLFPQTPEALARNMADRYPRIRYAACLAMSFLAKRNRVEVVSNRIIMYSIARVLEVDKNGALARVSVSDCKVFVGSRLCALKMLLHLSKNRDVSAALARTECIPSALVNIANKMELAANILCVATLTNLTRHPENSEHLVFNIKGLVPTLLNHIVSGSVRSGGGGGEDADNHECAKCALYALQNLSCSNNCRQELANTPNLLAALTKAAFKTQHRDQQLSALHTLKHLSDDPFNLVTMTNTPGCSATLLALANDGNNVMAQYLACDTLATLSHWLLTLSTAKTRKGQVVGEDDDNEVGRRTFQTLTWEQWA